MAKLKWCYNERSYFITLNCATLGTSRCLTFLRKIPRSAVQSPTIIILNQLWLPNNIRSIEFSGKRKIFITMATNQRKCANAETIYSYVPFKVETPQLSFLIAKGKSLGKRKGTVSGVFQAENI